MCSQRMNAWATVICLIFLLMTYEVDTLDNGLALRPPMGWMSWQRFRCQTDCSRYPDDCLSEKLIKRTADKLVETKLKDAGYVYVIIDDCWPTMARDPQTHELLPDPSRFPSGLRELSDYIHKRGLLFGIYLDYGKYTCAGYPGTLGHLEEDAKSLAKWGVDYVKVDGCYADPREMPDGYQLLGKYLNQTGRPIVYSCSYPAYINWLDKPDAIDWKRLATNCNLWRMLEDVQDSWASVTSILKHYATHEDLMFSTNGVGHWNDMDMLLLGNYGLSEDQMRVQMGVWSLLSVPLLLSADLDTIDPVSLSLAKNPRLLELNQDISGWQSARKVKEVDGVQVWVRNLGKDWALAFIRFADGGFPMRIEMTLEQIDTRIAPEVYEFVDIFTGETVGKRNVQDQWAVKVNPSGIVLYRLKPTPNFEDNPWSLLAMRLGQLMV
ncbi:unnamed protein product [Calicophoron daubneyi]|uniref:Alpha-galactosidase n=1 Tax=Calicophoron daubneyi TaxID=300641 RepID=A0AAV2TA60_CALDB